MPEFLNFNFSLTTNHSKSQPFLSLSSYPFSSQYGLSSSSNSNNNVSYLIVLISSINTHTEETLSKRKYNSSRITHWQFLLRRKTCLVPSKTRACKTMNTACPSIHNSIKFIQESESPIIYAQTFKFIDILNSAPLASSKLCNTAQSY